MIQSMKFSYAKYVENTRCRIFEKKKKSAVKGHSLSHLENVKFIHDIYVTRTKMAPAIL